MMKKFGRCLMLGAVLGITAFGSFSATAADADEKPIGGMKTPTGQFKPIYRIEPIKVAEQTKARVDTMAETLADVKINRKAENAEEAWKGSISLRQHREDIAKLRDQFVLCTADLQNRIGEKEAAGGASIEEKETLQACLDHCKRALDKMDKMHFNSSVMITATRQKVFLDSWEKHQTMMQELKEEMANCPMMVKEAIACCDRPGRNPTPDRQSTDQTTTSEGTAHN